MPYIDPREHNEAKENRIREGRARKATRSKCRYDSQPCGTCKYLESCEDDGKFLAANGY